MIHEFIKKCNLGAESVFIEIGANTGINSEIIKKNIGKSRFYMFEPDEKKLKILYEKGINKLGNLFPIAISDTKCESNTVQEVEKISLDLFCDMEEINHIDFIWMDIKGCEDLVFKGAAKILEKTQYIYTEYKNSENCDVQESIIYSETYEGQESIIRIIELLPGDWRMRQDFGGYAIFENLTYKDNLLDNTGSWAIKDMNEHAFDPNLALEITKFVKTNRLKNCVDFGCGPGEYVKFLRSEKIKCKGYDGNIHTEEITKGKCKILDLTSDFTLVNKFDCVISLEVGEHIPNELENKFISNICKHANKYIIISWGIPGQGGYGHINCQTNEYIKNRFKDFGFSSCDLIAEKFREESILSWFKNTIMVYKKDNV